MCILLNNRWADRGRYILKEANINLHQSYRSRTDMCLCTLIDYIDNSHSIKRYC